MNRKKRSVKEGSAWVGRKRLEDRDAQLGIVGIQAISHRSCIPIWFSERFASEVDTWEEGKKDHVLTE